ncbi:MAG: protease inhibitor I42 family protein [Candidatus Omnitrophica bacterium]|nr:protease inhibitor I42 family protein [Candidatus Omnitrophota bacterium]
MRGVRLILAVFLMIAFSGCASQKNIKVSVSGDTSIDLEKKGIVDIELEANPSTGYSWAVSPLADETVLKQIGGGRYTQKSSLAGGGGYQIFRFRGTEQGKEEITFKYRRPWERNQPPAKEYDVEINVW